jgi:hypothetical protein
MAEPAKRRWVSASWPQDAAPYDHIRSHRVSSSPDGSSGVAYRPGGAIRQWPDGTPG